MKQLLREYLSFNRRERKGVFVLLLIILALLFYLCTADIWQSNPAVDFSKFESDIEKWETSFVKDSLTDTGKINAEEVLSVNDSFREKDSVEYFAFDPNNLSAKKWQQLGLSTKQIAVIYNYEAKGGRFYTKEDLRKIYSINEEQYKILAPFVDIPQEQNAIITNKNNSSDVKEKNVMLVELNTSTKEELLALKGIGPFYAKEIIKLRTRLGGFYSKDQLLEMWKFDTDKLATLDSFISIDINHIERVNINTCTSAELKHPYLTWTQTNAIINYRTAHGGYENVEGVKNTGVISDELYLKISPYLKIK